MKQKSVVWRCWVSFISLASSFFCSASISVYLSAVLFQFLVTIWKLLRKCVQVLHDDKRNNHSSTSGDNDITAQANSVANNQSFFFVCWSSFLRIPLLLFSPNGTHISHQHHHIKWEMGKRKKTWFNQSFSSDEFDFDFTNVWVLAKWLCMYVDLAWNAYRRSKDAVDTVFNNLSGVRVWMCWGISRKKFDRKMIWFRDCTSMRSGKGEWAGDTLYQ